MEGKRVWIIFYINKLQPKAHTGNYTILVGIRTLTVISTEVLFLLCWLSVKSVRMVLKRTKATRQREAAGQEQEFQSIGQVSGVVMNYITFQG